MASPLAIFTVRNAALTRSSPPRAVFSRRSATVAGWLSASPVMLSSASSWPRTRDTSHCIASFWYWNSRLSSSSPAEASMISTAKPVCPVGVSATLKARAGSGSGSGSMLRWVAVCSLECAVWPTLSLLQYA